MKNTQIAYATLNEETKSSGENSGLSHNNSKACRDDGISNRVRRRKTTEEEFRKMYSYLGCIGNGSYGNVYKAIRSGEGSENQSSGSVVAIKEVSLFGFDDDSIIDDNGNGVKSCKAEDEVNILRKLSGHINIVTVFDCCIINNTTTVKNNTMKDNDEYIKDIPLNNMDELVLEDENNASYSLCRSMTLSNKKVMIQTSFEVIQV